MDCNPPGSSVHGILQARVLEWVLPFPPPGIFPDPGIKLVPPAFTDKFFTIEPPGKLPWSKWANGKNRPSIQSPSCPPNQQLLPKTIQVTNMRCYHLYSEEVCMVTNSIMISCFDFLSDPGGFDIQIFILIAREGCLWFLVRDYLKMQIEWSSLKPRLQHSLWSPYILSVQFNCSVVSDSLQPHEMQHARPPCPSPTPGVYPNSCPLSRWCHPAITSSIIPFSSCLQSFPASGSLQMSQLFASGGQSTGVSASTSVLPMNTQDWSPLGWTGWISLQSKGLSRVFSNTTVQKHQFFCTHLSL